MESLRLNELAARYWQGECSLAEEQELEQALLQMEQVPEALQELKEYVMFLKEERKSLTLDQSFDKEILQKIDSRPPRTLVPMRWWSMAAAVAMLIAVSFGIIQSLDEPPKQEITAASMQGAETQIAFQEVKKALFVLSSKLNKGLAHTAVLGEFHHHFENHSNNQNQNIHGYEVN